MKLHLGDCIIEENQEGSEEELIDDKPIDILQSSQDIAMTLLKRLTHHIQEKQEEQQKKDAESKTETPIITVDLATMSDSKNRDRTISYSLNHKAMSMARKGSLPNFTDGEEEEVGTQSARELHKCEDLAFRAIDLKKSAQVGSVRIRMGTRKTLEELEAPNSARPESGFVTAKPSKLTKSQTHKPSSDTEHVLELDLSIAVPGSSNYQQQQNANSSCFQLFGEIENLLDDIVEELTVN